jgi:glycosyltransferase involved in cell wall biosynthesis
LHERYHALKKCLDSEVDVTLILVDDGNAWETDEAKHFLTAQIPELQWISYVRNRGKGYALRKGVEASRAKYILYTDVDFPYSTESMAAMLQCLFRTVSDVVIGTRDESYYRYLNYRRLWISKTLRQSNKHLFRLASSDTQCGLKAFRAEVKSLFAATRTNRYLIDLEFMKILSRSSFKVDTLPVNLRPDIALSRISKLNLGYEALSYLRILLFA